MEGNQAKVQLCSQCERVFVNEESATKEEEKTGNNLGKEEVSSKGAQQMKEDVQVYITMSIIVLLAFVVTVIKVMLKRYVLGQQEGNNSTETGGENFKEK